jgi:hypothetical protein
MLLLLIFLVFFEPHWLSSNNKNGTEQQDQEQYFNANNKIKSNVSMRTTRSRATFQQNNKIKSNISMRILRETLGGYEISR